jgi:hypothetical protein
MFYLKKLSIPELVSEITPIIRTPPPVTLKFGTC